MKKDFCLVLMCLAAVTLCAQPAGHFRQGDHHWDKVERLMAKNGYTHRLASYRTSDNYQLCTFSYSGDGRLIAIRDTVRNEYSLIDSLSYNEDGQMVRMSGWQLLDNRWVNVYYIDYTYENGNLASRANYNNFDGSWELGGVYRYSYDPEGRILLSELTMGGIVFQRVEQLVKICIWRNIKNQAFKFITVIYRVIYGLVNVCYSKIGLQICHVLCKEIPQPF